MDPTLRPKKRRKTKNDQPLIEGEALASNAVTTDIIQVQTRHGVISRQVFVPLDSHNTGDRQAPESGEMMPMPEHWAHDSEDIVNPERGPNLNKQQQYLRDFAGRIEDLLKAHVEREAKIVIQPCLGCQSGVDAHWRCRDCITGEILCRGCMRRSHMTNPFHWVEHWTGTYFRPTSLREVGIYILINHRQGGLCDSLKLQMQVRDEAERCADEQDMQQPTHQTATPRPVDGCRMPPPEFETAADDNGDEEEEDTLEALWGEFLEDNDQRPILQTGADEICVVHTNGVHALPVILCECHGKDECILDITYSGFLPTSFTRVSTLFTNAVLDDFRIANLECKVTTYQYWQRLRRITSPMTPSEVPNRYKELGRMSRIWRWMKKLKWAGFAQTPDRKAATAGNGELTIFCPACPQPGINIKENWKDDTNRWVYRRVYVADGNFKADHVRQRANHDEIWLWDGAGMMPNNSEYGEFLRTAVERNTKAPCENQFRAIEMSMLSSKACDVTGIVGIACARHGCFAPNGIVNLFKGEQQKNVDWALIKSLRTTNMDNEQGLLLIYDIACQYFIHLQDRVGHLLPSDLTIDRGIGSFHVHGHQESCLFRYGTAFIPGAGITAGEILESLWSNMNSITPAARTATLAHRAEILDDHASDSNFKKMLGLPVVLADRYLYAADMLAAAIDYYEKMSSTIAASHQKIWEADITNAETRRLQDPAGMDILGTRKSRSHPAPSESTAGHATDSDNAIRMALRLEERQLELQSQVRQTIQRPSGENEAKVENLRAGLLAAFAALDNLLERSNIVQEAGQYLPFIDDADVFDNLDDDLDDHDSTRPMVETQVMPVERRPIPLPSHINPDDPSAVTELILRQEQAAALLKTIRTTIADKSFQYSHVLRVAPRKGVKTRARNTILKLNHQLAADCIKYCRCRAAMLRLKAGPAIIEKFKPLLKSDIKASTAILNPNVAGASTMTLSWIWQMAGESMTSASENVMEFRRVHWLRARAQRNRWSEEFTLIKYEMEWTTKFFQHSAQVWAGRALVSEHDHCGGPAAHAHRQSAVWQKMAISAETLFSDVQK